MSDVVTERRGETQWIRLNRPERRNAFDSSMLIELTKIFEDSRDAGVIVITGSQGSFCAGGYLSTLADPDPETLRELFYGALRLFDEIRLLQRPVIAAVNGAAIGGGNELVVACDLAVAAESATFGQTGVRVGSAPVLGGTNLLALNIGEKRAKEVSFLCRRYSAKEALSMGWVNAVVPDSSLEDEVTRWADELLGMSPRYLEIAKISSNVWWNSIRDSYLAGLGMLVQAIGSEDMIEGAKAFIEKRNPAFRKKPLRTEVKKRS